MTTRAILSAPRTQPSRQQRIESATLAPRRGLSLSTALGVYLKPRVLIVLLLGFSAGLPLALSADTLRVWMADRGVDVGTIGLISLASLPYSIKFLWAPAVDALSVPWLSERLGRRRSWLVASQLGLMAAIGFLGTRDPVAAPLALGLGALLVAFASATQDIVIDAYRVESLGVEEQAAGMAGYIAAYRVGMLVSGAGVIALTSRLEAEGFGPGDIRLQRAVDMRYRRQVHIVTVPFPAGDVTAESLEQTVDAFERLYEEKYGPQSAYREAGIELVSFRLRGSGSVGRHDFRAETLGDADASDALVARVEAWVDKAGAMQEVPGYDFERLRPGNAVEGPAVVWSPITTLVVPVEHTARVDEYRSIVLTTS